MPQNKKQHYVPKFLLRRFSTDKKSINLYNIKSKRKITNANLSNQCYSDYLYGKDLQFEKWLSGIEGELAKLLRIMDVAIIPPPPWSTTHDIMIFFVLSQHGRTKYAAEALNETWDKMTKAIFREMMAAQGLDIDRVTIGIKEPAKHALTIHLSGHPLLLDLHYKTLLNKTSVGFVISDHPVVFYNQLLSWRVIVSNCGMASKGLQIFMPLDSKKMLLMYDKDVYRVGSDSKGVIEIANPRDVYELNTLQVVSANDNIYFEDPSMDIEALRKKAEPFLRKRKVNVETVDSPEPDGRKAQLIANSSEDIRTNLSLSFVSLRGKAKKWLDEIRHVGEGPALIVRNPVQMKVFDEFQKACKAGKYKGSEFRKFLEDFVKGRATGETAKATD